MNIGLGSWTRPQAGREKGEKFALCGQKPVNLTHRVHKKKRKSPQKQGLQRKKKGDRESLSPVNGGAGGI